MVVCGAGLAPGPVLMNQAGWSALFSEPSGTAFMGVAVPGSPDPVMKAPEHIGVSAEGGRGQNLASV